MEQDDAGTRLCAVARLEDQQGQLPAVGGLREHEDSRQAAVVERHSIIDHMRLQANWHGGTPGRVVMP